MGAPLMPIGDPLSHLDPASVTHPALDALREAEATYRLVLTQNTAALETAREARVRAVFEARRAGMTRREMALALDLTVSTVRGLLWDAKTLGLTLDPPDGDF